MKFVWFNGKFVKFENAKTSILDHALHYGTSIFEGIRAYETIDKNSAIFRLNDHVKRFFRSAKTLLIKLPFSRKEIFEGCIETVRKNKLKECYIRPIAWLGYGGIGIGVEAPVNVAIAALPFKGYFEKKDGIKAKIVEHTRPNPRSFPPNVKIGGSYALSRIATMKAKLNGFDEAILLDYKGNVAEGAAENIFVLKNSKLFTPPAESILAGITRESVMEIARDLKIGCEIKFFGKNFLYNADEAFLTGTAAGITPILSIDRKKIGNGKPGKITMKIKEIYESIVRGGIEKYKKWLTYVY